MGKAKGHREPAWASLSDDALLRLRFCDLGLSLRGTPLAGLTRRLQRELNSRDLRLRPHYWISTEWFVAHGVSGIAVPFYLLHPRLIELERAQTGQAEGETAGECLRILRHEAGHAVENAFRLRRRREVQTLFGASTRTKYPSRYFPKPYSRRYVRHLEPYYAQSHPDEDFAETFAVWLPRGSRWRERYAEWPALAKLELMDRLMTELRGQPGVRQAEHEVEPIASLTETLGHHYRKRRSHLRQDRANALDRDLRKVFAAPKGGPREERASRFLARVRREVRSDIALRTGQYHYTVDKVLKDAIARCRDLDLYVRRSPSPRGKVARRLAASAQKYIEKGHHEVPI